MTDEQIKHKERSTSLAALQKLALDRFKRQHPNVPEYAIPAPKYNDRTSNGLTKCIIDFINMKGFQAERINSTGRQVDTRQQSTDVLGRVRTIGGVKWIKGTGQTGTADISATIKGRSVKIEVKCKATGDNYQSQGQKDYQKKIEQAGGVYIIVRDFSDLLKWYNKFISQI